MVLVRADGVDRAGDGVLAGLGGVDVGNVPHHVALGSAVTVGKSDLLRLRQLGSDVRIGRTLIHRHILGLQVGVVGSLGISRANRVVLGLGERNNATVLGVGGEEVVVGLQDAPRILGIEVVGFE